MNTIEIEHVSFRYIQNRKNVISELTLTANGADSIILIGDNGSGKSTIGKIICGLLIPTGGNIKINGENPNNLLPEKRIRLAYYIPQINHLQTVKNTLLGEINFSKNISGKDSGMHEYNNYFLPSNLRINPFELPINESWRFAMYLADLIDPIVLFIDEIPSISNQLNKKALAFLLEKRKNNYRITIIASQRKIEFGFSQHLLIRANKIYNIQA